MFDTHAHLFDKKLIFRLDTILSELKTLNYTGIVCILETEQETDLFLEFYNKFSFLYCSIGIHPHNADKFNLKNLHNLFKKLYPTNRLVAIGEIGLDFYYNFSNKNSQLDCFKNQILFAKEVYKPVIIHSRQSNSLVIDLLKKYDINQGVFHCFSGDVKEMREIVSLGLKIGITGIITFPNAEILRNVVISAMEKSLVVETDCPYLSPIPFRGKINSPLNLKYIISKIAQVKNCDFAKLETILDENSKKLFNL